MIKLENFPLSEAAPYIAELKEEIKEVVKNLDLDNFIKAKGFDRHIREKSSDPHRKWEAKNLFAFKNIDVIRDILTIVFTEAVDQMAKQSMYHDEDEIWLVSVETGWSHGSQVYSNVRDAVIETGLYTVKVKQLAFGYRDEFGLPFEVYEIVPRTGRHNQNVVACMEDWWCMPA